MNPEKYFDHLKRFKMTRYTSQEKHTLQSHTHINVRYGFGKTLTRSPIWGNIVIKPVTGIIII